MYTPATLKMIVGIIIKDITLCVLFVLLPGNSYLHAQWMENGTPVCSSYGNQYSPQIVTDGAGGAIVVWEDMRRGCFIYAQRIADDGCVLWSVDGVNICAEEGSKCNAHIASDGTGGAIVAWRDFRDGSGRIYAQKIDANGNLQWVQGGIDCLTDGIPMIVSDGLGGAYLIFGEPWQTNSDIYAQRINANGSLLWAAEGIAICTEESDQAFYQVVSDGAGGTIIVWRDSRNGTYGIYAQKIDASGTVQWETDGVAVCTGDESKSYHQVISDKAGGAIVAWFQAYEDTVLDIYAQNIDANGNLRWGTSGVPVCTEENEQSDPQIVSDGVGGAIITWCDYRNDHSSYYYNDIYAQRINNNGEAQWTQNGVAICTADDIQFRQQVVIDGAGGAIIAWQDHRYDSDIYVQAIDSKGTVRWKTDGISLCREVNGQFDPRLISDGRGGAITTWQDDRRGGSMWHSYDVYAMKVHEFGSVVTILDAYSTRLDGFDIVLTWSLVEIGVNAEFHILRAESDSETFKEIPDPAIYTEVFSFTFSDQSCEPGKSYRYRVDVSDESGHKLLFETDVIDVPELPPVLPLTLYQNYPNPFNPVTTIKYHLPETCRVIIEIYSVAGNRVTTLVDEYKFTGDHTVEWNGTDYQNNGVGSGIYFYRLTTGEETLSRKMVLLR